MVDLTQDCVGPKEGTVFPGFSPVVAENTEGGSGDFEVTADHLTHNSGDLTPSPGLISRK